MNIQLSEPPTIRSFRNSRHAWAIRRDLRILRHCAMTLVVIAVLFACVAGRDILAPTAVAVTLALVLAPIARAFEKLAIPTGIASVFTVVATVSLLTLGAMQLAPQASAWIEQAPKITQAIERKLRPLTRQIAAVESASNRIAQIGSGPAQRSVTVSEGSLLMNAARTAPRFVENSLFVTVLTIFLLACRRHYTAQLMLLPRTFPGRLRMARIVRDVRHRVSSYLFTLTTINIGLALVTAAAFYLAGISEPLLWGIAFGLFNYLPIFGPTSVVLAAAIYGFATAATIPEAMIPPLILLALNTVESNLVQPWMLSRRIVVSPIVIFLMVVTLVWMWGPAAAITAVPLLIFFHAIAIHVPQLKPVAILLATEDGRGQRHARPKKLRNKPDRKLRPRPLPASSSR